MWAHDFYLLCQTSITHYFLYHYAMVMQFSALNKNFIGFIMQFTECKQSVPVLRYDLWCSLCPHALFSQARSHMRESAEIEVAARNIGVFLLVNMIQTTMGKSILHYFLKNSNIIENYCNFTSKYCMELTHFATIYLTIVIY